ncbi:hypothetical protein DE4585_02662 [Mycobacteroides salmoniphilum]|uniref:DUF3558 domain-containing protein n=1 Tax=Mycobacteroides salmoniphilum TaxID=404941 RepID=A0A4R8S0G3_9MYCO|nr:DUF3558 family protein [Mycobacteroides salmoniphilum]TDZ82130.1 hypothetical protein DE4585_02662 [Mycobacteroides salmoniphilum]
MASVGRFAIVAASAVLAAGCTHDGIQGASTAATGSTSSSSSSSSKNTPSTTSSTVSDPVKGTTFDACSSISSTDVATWNVDPANKRDAHKTAFGQNVRGCIWGGANWFIKVYAVDTPLSRLAEPNDRWDRHEQVTVGARSGWLIRDVNGMSCSVSIPSQQAIATVQVDLKTDLHDQRYDQCPLALLIARQIEPKIP